MKKELKRIFQISLGILVLIVGVVGLFLPFLQGIVMIVFGIHLIYPEKAKEIIIKSKCLIAKFRDR